MALIHTRGIDFHIEEYGNGTPLVLLHGFTGSSASWSRVGSDLARDYRIIAIDLIGHGASSAPRNASRYAFEYALDDLAHISSQRGLTQAAWLGYSLGGRLALGLALRHPNHVAALILESATAGIHDDQEQLDRRAADENLATRIESAGVASFVADWERLPMWKSQSALPEDVLRQQREVRLRNSAVGLANSLRGMGQGAQPSYWHRLGELDVPVLLIAGALDRKFLGIAGQMGIKIRDATLSVIPDAGHAVHLEQPEEFSATVRDFLARQVRLSASIRQESRR